ncbi:Carboxylesterase, type B [Chondromyces apiculatus DSM 436]|uniref:Carboxylic ester hydrolase n=1 Tax=Chondromyces apiculatus DSM 436 TaxID=1192034 RepID=A0A017TE64_9BACT|nr:Carboxylesterase, type B [Chondromyces apiculatus DSM 436]
MLVWLHGGGGANGAAHFFGARRLATDEDLIVVTVNYRLGIFGTFSHPGLDGSGTFGLQDQQAALRWVQRNIAAFGGDPANVTLFGQSAGALHVTAQLTSPPAGDLFHRAAIQSGLAFIDYPAGTFMPGSPPIPAMRLTRRRRRPRRLRGRSARVPRPGHGARLPARPARPGSAARFLHLHPLGFRQ